MDETLLTPVDVTSLTWARAMLRVILQDKHAPYRFSDAELETQLTLHAFTPNAAPFYRPHVAAATIIEGDPERAISEGIDNASETRESPRLIAHRILRRYAMLDRRIAAEAGVHPDPAPGEAQVLF